VIARLVSAIERTEAVRVSTQSERMEAADSSVGSAEASEDAATGEAADKRTKGEPQA